jgi:hypothetical protein
MASVSSGCLDTETTLILSGVGSIVLKAPEFGNQNKVVHGRVQRRNRANILTVFRPDYWPQSEPLNYRFILTDTEKAALIVFLKDNVGELITVTDHENQVYIDCFLVNTPVEFTHLNNCLFQTELEFEQML